MAEFEVGANLPWIDYGLDFGANRWQPEGGLARPDRRERLRAALAPLSASGASLVRLFVLADGRAGVRFDARGRPAGLDACVPEDLRAALDELRAAGLRAILVLLDYLWLARGRQESGVTLGGRRSSIHDPDQRARLVHEVLVPLVAPHRGDPAIAAVEVMNEPEWATLGLGTLDPTGSVSRRTMRTFLGDAARALEPVTSAPVTVGLARARWLDLVHGLGLGLHQVHWYERLDPIASLERPVAALGLDRPVLLGEFPTRGCSVPPTVLLDLARRAGYCGALAWSARATDRASDGPALHASLAAWTRTGRLAGQA